MRQSSMRFISQIKITAAQLTKYFEFYYKKLKKRILKKKAVASTDYYGKL